MYDTCQVEMATAQLRHKTNYDYQRKPDLNLKSREKVWFLPYDVHITPPLKKFDYKKIGLFNILARIGTRAYKFAFHP